MGQYVSSHGDVISHVNVSSVHVSDGGTYTCTARNNAGETSHSARLNVYGPPVVRQMGDMTVVAGTTLVVTCPVGGYPIYKISWSKGESKNKHSIFILHQGDFNVLLPSISFTIFHLLNFFHKKFLVFRVGALNVNYV